MKLPNRERAHVSLEKLTGYLLSEDHPEGGSKARLLRTLGFDISTMVLLQNELLQIARSEDVAQVVPSKWGNKYVVNGALETPVGRSIRFSAVWFIGADDERPRFVYGLPN